MMRNRSYYVGVMYVVSAILFQTLAQYPRSPRSPSPTNWESLVNVPEVTPLFHNQDHTTYPSPHSDSVRGNTAGPQTPPQQSSRVSNPPSPSSTFTGRNQPDLSRKRRQETNDDSPSRTAKRQRGDNALITNNRSEQTEDSLVGYKKYRKAWQEKNPQQYHDYLEREKARIRNKRKNMEPEQRSKFLEKERAYARNKRQKKVEELSQPGNEDELRKYRERERQISKKNYQKRVERILNGTATQKQLEAWKTKRDKNRAREREKRLREMNEQHLSHSK